MIPVIALDVDGVLAPFGDVPQFNPQHGLWLNRMLRSCELVWATSWMHQANIEVAPALALPELPVLTKGEVLGYGSPRPLVWLDDMFYVREYLQDNPCERSVLYVGPDPHVGLVDSQMRRIEHWLAEL